MVKKTLLMMLSSSFFLLSMVSYTVPAVAAEPDIGPVIVQHLGKLEWPQDEVTSTPYLTQLLANDINDLHGNLSCELIISTPGNYHMALKDAMFGDPDLLPEKHVGLLEQEGTPNQFKVSICWSTSPPVSIDQITAEELQFKNIKMVGRPSLVMAPGAVMNELVANGMVDADTRETFLVNQGNVILIRNDKAGVIKNVCDLDGITRVVTPNPYDEPGSFKNFSETIFNVAAQNTLGCDATKLFESIFLQDLNLIDTSSFNNPYDINGVLSVFGRGTKPQGTGAKWVASSRIMHRDIPYALCHDEADAGVIFYHQAVYLKKTLASTGCHLEIVPLGGTVENPQPLPGNRVGTLHIAKVNGTYFKKVNDARDKIYDFLTTDPNWKTILEGHGMRR
ncbi:MAG TPA: hypothetical protein DCO77_09115 [Nitrospiraceae bacterium]|nr:hypothetical protein [Nitrospiraceae bacterium]